MSDGPAIIWVAETYSQASIHLNKLMLERHGPDATPDDFDIVIFDVPHAGSDRKGKAVCACPKGMIPAPENVLIAYWGDRPRNAPTHS